jgi:hypothetical protein
MSRFSRFIIAVALLVSGCQRRQPAESLPSAVPRFVCPDATRSLGRIALEKHTTPFRIWNRGAADLVIHRIDVSCSCARARLEHSIIPPNQEREILVSIHPRQSESRGVMITVHTNEADQPIRQLRLVWEARSALEPQPDTIDFGVVRPGSTVSRELRLTAFQLGEDTIERIELEARPEAQVSVLLLEQLADAYIYRVTLTPLVSHVEQGVVRFDVHWPEKPSTRIVVPILWSLRDEIDVSPPRLFLSSRAATGLATGTLMVSSDNGTKLQLEGIEWDSAWKSSSQVERVSDSTLRIQVHAETETHGLQSGLIRLRIMSPVAKIVEVPVSMFIRPPSADDGFNP